MRVFRHTFAAIVPTIPAVVLAKPRWHVVREVHLPVNSLEASQKNKGVDRQEMDP